MSDVAPLDFPKQTVVACELCGRSGDVPWYCKNCQGSLCDSCKQSHREIAIFKRHSVVPRTGEVLRLHVPARIAEQCHKHKTYELSTYCNECKVACCVVCLAECHKRHDFSPIADAYLSAETRLNDYIKQLQREVKVQLQGMLTQTQEIVEDRTNHTHKTKDEVNAFREEVKRAVDKAFDSIIDKIDQPNSDLADMLRKLNIDIQNVDELIRECTERIREGKLDLISYTPTSPSTLIPTVNLTQSTYPSFVAHRGFLNILDKQLGSIKYQDTKELRTSKVLKRKDEVFNKKMINVNKLKSFTTEIDATSITTAGNNTAWVTDCASGTMYLYSDSGEVVRSVTVMKGKGIHDMVISPSGEMIVTNGDKEVRCVSVRGKVATLIDTAPFYALGVCLTDRGEIVVCMDGRGKRNHVAVYSSDGRKKIREIGGQDTKGKKLITSPYRVVQNGDDLCVVNVRKDVVCVDERDVVRWVYDGTQSKLERSFDPHGICRDKYSNLLVTDYYNHCVHYIDREGQLLQVILTQDQTGLEDHYGISVDDETGQVWIGNIWKHVVVAKFVHI